MLWRTLAATVVLGGFTLNGARAEDAWNYSDASRTGTFTQDGNGWIEEFEFKGKDLSGRGRDKYTEAERTSEYVELTGDRFRSVRLYADHLERRLGDGKWDRLYKGSWGAAPSVVRPAVVAGTRPANSGTASASRQAPPQVWAFTKGNKTGSFTKTGDSWDQQIDSKVGDRVVTEHRQFREMARTDDYVELSDGQDFTLRLYADRAEVDSGNGNWRQLYNGGWDKSASAQASATGGGQPAVANRGSAKAAGGRETRNLWKWENQKNASGTLTRTATGWREDKVIIFGNSRRTEMMTYRETESTPEYIEMIDDRRNVINRCYDDHTEWRFGNGQWVKEWQGGWVSDK
jgi:hypothetical protein